MSCASDSNTTMPLTDAAEDMTFMESCGLLSRSSSVALLGHVCRSYTCTNPCASSTIRMWSPRHNCLHVLSTKANKAILLLRRCWIVFYMFDAACLS